MAIPTWLSRENEKSAIAKYELNLQLSLLPKRVKKLEKRIAKLEKLIGGKSK